MKMRESELPEGNDGEIVFFCVKYTSGAIHGTILVKIRNYSEREPLPSKGAMYSPTGLSPLSHPYKEIPKPSLSCSKPGRYRLLVDVITESGVQSYEKSFEVIP